MIKMITAAAFLLLVASCKNPTDAPETTQQPIQGVWKLISGTLIEKKDTVVTDYLKGKSFEKIIYDGHFSFLGHDLNKGKDSAAFYSSGGGTYTLTDSSYTEHLIYCYARGWEGNDFHFSYKVDKDTLVITGIEKIDSIGVNRINIEKYARATK
ncbi:MAG: hypothetical protein J7539_05200 [Niabella sp.]|nr:hypothetical protein [Niabella sp.]